MSVRETQGSCALRRASPSLADASPALAHAFRCPTNTNAALSGGVDGLAHAFDYAGAASLRRVLAKRPPSSRRSSSRPCARPEGHPRGEATEAQAPHSADRADWRVVGLLLLRLRVLLRFDRLLTLQSLCPAEALLHRRLHGLGRPHPHPIAGALR